MSHYLKGAEITSLDELYKQDFVYLRDKLVHNGWFKNWSLSNTKRNMNFGLIHYAILLEEY